MLLQLTNRNPNVMEFGLIPKQKKKENPFKFKFIISNIFKPKVVQLNYHIPSVSNQKVQVQIPPL